LKSQDKTLTLQLVIEPETPSAIHMSQNIQIGRPGEKGVEQAIGINTGPRLALKKSREA
jgi:hypothetical protein